jgi:hypothetical protein
MITELLIINTKKHERLREKESCNSGNKWI